MNLLGDGLALVLGHRVVLDVLDLLAVLAVRPGQVDGLLAKQNVLNNISCLASAVIFIRIYDDYM